MWLMPSMDSYSVLYFDPLHPDAIRVDKLPPGEGILRRADDGTFYHEPFEPTPEPTPEPIFDTQSTQSQTLINTEMLLIYKELGI